MYRVRNLKSETNKFMFLNNSFANINSHEIEDGLFYGGNLDKIFKNITEFSYNKNNNLLNKIKYEWSKLFYYKKNNYEIFVKLNDKNKFIEQCEFNMEIHSNTIIKEKQ